MQLYGAIEEKGYKFEAYLPTSDGEPVAWEVRISIGDERKHVLLIPMTYVPVFGPDAGDVHHLEFVVDRIIAFLPEPGAFNAETLSELKTVEKEVGAKRARKQHASELESPKRRSGDFQYTGDLFAAKFADIVGGREAMDQWMKTKLPQLGDRSPEDALRLGMGPEVLKCLENIARQSSPKTSGEAGSSS